MRKHNIILFDLEANPSPEGYMEIIEIGACKVTRTKEEGLIQLDEFNRLVKPSINKKLAKRVTKLTHITMEQLDKADDFQTVIEEFVKWAGDNAVFISWGNDIDWIDCNLFKNYIWNAPEMPSINLQNIYDIANHTPSQTGLMQALTHLDCEFDGEAHTALDDAKNMLPILDRYYGQTCKRINKMYPNC